ncbi:hypothetical protein EDD15DRAFT_711290 [Pisolithus albus]|nr:hypothetical protein EDD15DRAFT_711290 [Pisolithus albus]
MPVWGRLTSLSGRIWTFLPATTGRRWLITSRFDSIGLVLFPEKCGGCNPSLTLRNHGRTGSVLIWRPCCNLKADSPSASEGNENEVGGVPWTSSEVVALRRGITATVTISPTGKPCDHLSLPRKRLVPTTLPASFF